MSDLSAVENLPPFLRSFDDLTAHFDEHFGDLGSNQKGDTFLELARKILPLTEEGQEFPIPTPNEKKSHDGGVDLLAAENSVGKVLCAQSKYKLRSKDEFDTVVSKFQNYEASLFSERQRELFASAQASEERGESIPVFFVITSSKLGNVIQRYEESTLASVAYYRQLQDLQRIVVIDGPRILHLLQQLYRKTHLVPATVRLRSVAGWSQSGGVYLGIMPGSDLVSLYDFHGDALFFENIREFLGASSGKVVTTRSTVNHEIINTISNEPTKMLARNNGVTFRAEGVEVEGDGVASLRVAAIVNGCQTTMCLVQCAPVSEECLVQVKVVKTSDAWDIAKAANYQNPIARVDLDLARYLRPQLVRRAAAGLGYAVEGESDLNASSVLNAIYRHKIEYEELKLLYLGLFSRKPNNLFEGNYAELRADILAGLYDSTGGEEEVFSVLLLLLKEGRFALSNCEKTYDGPEYASVFKRFYNDEKPRYRVYLAVVAICALLRDDLADRSISTEEEVVRMQRFIRKARVSLENQPNFYYEAYLFTFQAIADSVLDVSGSRSEGDIAQSMYNKVSSTSFSSVYKKVLMRLDADRRRRSGSEV